MEEFITFNDVVIKPGLSPKEPSQITLKSKITVSHEISIPLLSSPMDTVTEARMAIVMARLGAVGVIHRNMSVEEQSKQVREVKDASVTLQEYFNVVEEGYTEQAPAVILHEGTPIGVLLPLRSDYKLLGEMLEYYVRLLLLEKVSPSTDDVGRLLVGGAISPFDEVRASALEKAGADFLVTDVAHLHNVNAINALKKLVSKVGIPVVAGNLGTSEGVLDVLTKIDSIGGLRMGISSGSICSTGEVAGASVPTLTAVLNARKALEELGAFGKIPIIADGGIRGAGDAAKAIIAGASAVMVGRLLAGSEESPSPKVRVGGKVYKVYRGMASRGAMEQRFASDRYSKPSKQLEEGVEGLVPYTGSVAKTVAHIYYGLQAALGYSGSSSIEDAWKAKLARITPIGMNEVKPHDIIID